MYPNFYLKVVCFVIVGLLLSCGQPVCIGGFGQCSISTDKQSTATATATPTAGSTLMLTAATTRVQVNGTLQLNATGGTTPYRFTITSGSGTLDLNTGLYTAPTVTGVAGVRVTDAANATYDMALVIY